MKERLIRLKNYLTSSFWALPLGLILFAFVFAYFTIQLDEWIDTKEIIKLNKFFAGSTDGYRNLLDTIGGSMMTIAGIVFSSTLVALTMAASQFGPRVLKNFMRDKLNQVVLGSYIATFLYCVLILRVVRPDEYIGFTPDISVFIAIILGIANIILLVFFIHHTASSIQAETLIRRIGAELIENLNSKSPNEKQSAYDIDNKDYIRQQYQKTDTITEIRKEKYGYIQYINIEELMLAAKEHDLIIKIYKKPGEYTLESELLGQVYTKNAKTVPEEVMEIIRENIVLSEVRSRYQDTSFIAAQLVEIALRALSPGINDPHTAISCIDKLAEALTILLKKDIFDDYIYDNEKNLRLEISMLSFENLVDETLGIIRQYAKNSPDVLRHLHATYASMIQLGIQHKLDEKNIEVLQNEQELVKETIEKYIDFKHDQEVAMQLY